MRETPVNNLADLISKYGRGLVRMQNAVLDFAFNSPNFHGSVDRVAEIRQMMADLGSALNGLGTHRSDMVIAVSSYRPPSSLMSLIGLYADWPAVRQAFGTAFTPEQGPALLGSDPGTAQQWDMGPAIRLYAVWTRVRAVDP